MVFETRLRSVLKASSWRLFGSLVTMLLTFIVTRRLDLSVSVGVLDVLIKFLLYFAHERVWNALHWGRVPTEPFVIWFTGLSGSGKSTLAASVHAELKKQGRKVEFIDGDSVRGLFPKTGFTKAERDTHIQRIGHLASTLERNGISVVASFISPYADSRRFVRGLCRNFIEVHVSTPLEVCEKRDAKGLYAKARRGETANFTGIDDPYEPPGSCELSVNTAELSKDEALFRVMDYMKRRGVNAS